MLVLPLTVFVFPYSLYFIIVLLSLLLPARFVATFSRELFVVLVVEISLAFLQCLFLQPQMNHKCGVFMQ
jgi:hypothetical protein